MYSLKGAFFSVSALLWDYSLCCDRGLPANTIGTCHNLLAGALQVEICDK